MELEKQVCSLELAKRLKELGVQGESLFVWIKTLYAYPEREEWSLWNKWEVDYEGDEFGTLEEQQDYAYAFTVAELGEVLPRQANVNGMQSWLCHQEEDLKWRIQYHYNINTLQEADTEADARALMLIYLLEKGLLTPPDTK